MNEFVIAEIIFREISLLSAHIWENAIVEKDNSYIVFTGLNTRLSLFCKKLYRMEETSLPR